MVSHYSESSSRLWYNSDMSLFLTLWAALILLAFVLSAWKPKEKGWRVAIALGSMGLLAGFSGVEPGWRLLAASVFSYWIVKALILIPSKLQGTELAAAWLWPGMRPQDFAARKVPSAESGKRFLRGWVLLWIGLTGLCVSSYFAPKLSPEVAGWLGIASILTAVHLGFADCLTALFQVVGFPVKPLFEQPESSGSLSDFWTKRWNRPFVDMNRALVMPKLTRLFGLRGAVIGSFLVSGLLHEMAISYPAGRGWGGPMLYFCLQLTLVLAERRLGLTSRVLTWAAVLLPLPLLFHSPFRNGLVTPMMQTIANTLHAHFGLSLFLLIAGSLHFLVLAASFQVPTRLNWKEELPRLSPFNRKLMLTYGAFVVLTIIGFGTLTLVLRTELLQHNIAARWLAGFIAVYWLTRVLVDCLYFKHSDWPKGPQFVIGHTLLTSLFLSFVMVYSWATLGIE